MILIFQSYREMKVNETHQLSLYKSFCIWSYGFVYLVENYKIIKIPNKKKERRLGEEVEILKVKKKA